MKIVCAANETVLMILCKFKKNVPKGRLLRYCIATVAGEGILLFNQLTREMVLLDEEEYKHLTENAELIDRWFVVPHDTNEKELVDLVRWMASARKKPLEKITKFSIFKFCLLFGT